MSDADQPISEIRRRRHRRAIARLINEERRKHGRRPLRSSRGLSVSARSWARAISRRSRFTHGDFARRSLRFPFVLNSRGRRWRVGELLAWGNGPRSTPRSIVNKWMRSPRHRRTILGDWQYGAAWTERDAPKPGLQRDSATVVYHLGRRR
jgi:uncharacterized protein YkwD